MVHLPTLNISKIIVNYNLFTLKYEVLMLNAFAIENLFTCMLFTVSCRRYYSTYTIPSVQHIKSNCRQCL